MALCIFETVKIKFIFKLMLSTLFLIVLNINPLLPKPNKNILKKNYLIERFNESLTRIEIYMLNGENKKVCKESIKVQKIINGNLNQLQLLEPYYDWDEINKLLKELPKQLCKTHRD